MTNSNSPADYVTGASDSREEDLRELFNRIDGHAEALPEGDSDEAREELDNLALSVEVVRTVEIVLRTGGPHEELRVQLDSVEGDVTGVTFFAVWGSDSRESRVETDSALYRYAVEVVEGMAL